jgi:hypothetical protein
MIAHGHSRRATGAKCGGSQLVRFVDEMIVCVETANMMTIARQEYLILSMNIMSIYILRFL